MTTPSLKIATKEITVVSWLDFNQTIEPIGGTSMRRMANGAAFKLTHWRKHRISLSGSGWIPAPLLAVNYDASFEIELPYPVTLLAAETLPTGWSQRSAPWAETTITDQAGFSLRVVYVKMTVYAEPPSQSIGGDPSWELVCETV